MASSAASTVPASVADSEPIRMVRLWSAPQPSSCTFATCGCARITSTTASSPETQRLRNPARDSGSSPKPFIMPFERSLSCLQAFSATRATIKCFLSAAVASAIPITATVASLGGASCTTGPNTRCRRRPPSSSPSNALTRPASGCCANSPFTNTREQADSCAACSAAIPFQPQPASAAAQVVGRRWQARRCSAIAPRVVVMPQWSQAASMAAILASRSRLRFLCGSQSRHSGQRRGSRRFQQSTHMQWPSRHWCTSPEGRSRHTGHARGDSISSSAVFDAEEATAIGCSQGLQRAG
mmetsp:Transcript_9170/g.21735  ORF Transcript_9170/g.21735 Transcript_9170/m.21735 type:complete len:297 (+) Transcript_9170:671-1561(+)